MLDTFVLARLRPLLSLDTPPARAYHLRQYDGRRQVDVVPEAADGRIVGLEVKATAAPTRDDARHLAWLRDQLGDRFVAGAVLNTGRWPFPLGDRIAAVPIAAFWANPVTIQGRRGRDRHYLCLGAFGIAANIATSPRTKAVLLDRVHR